MTTLRVLYHLALADFYERVRRYRFLLILAAVTYLGLLVNNGTMGMDLGPGDPNILIRYHGELNSAWIGTMTVMVTNTFLGLFGFYLVSDCIQRDIHTGVGQIIATTPVSRAAYLVGKWISNFVVLSVLVLILAAAAVIMVLVQSETALDLEALLMPFLAVALPNMALTAALAVFFETVPWLRGAVGNVIYFFAWALLLMLWFMAGTTLPFLKDPIGYNIFGTSLYESASAAFPGEPMGKALSVGSFNLPDAQIKLFNWQGLDWTAGIVGGNRERKNRTYQMVFSSARPVLRQLPAAWLAGVLATALFGIAGAVVYLQAGDLPALIGWAGAVLFVPTLALALGVFSSGSRLFEVVYVIWWYIGPLQKTPGMDFLSGPPHFYLLAAAGLLLLSAAWRGRQVRV